MNPRKILVICLVALTISAASAETHFDPKIGLSYGYNDNVTLATEEPEGSLRDDNLAVLDLFLEGQTVTRRTTFDFLYRPTLMRYDQETDLDRDEHRLRLRLKSDLSRKTDIDFRLDGTLTQVQGDATSVSDPDLFIGRRTDRELYRADFGLDTKINRRWSWGFNADGRFERFEPIPGFEGDPGAQVEDRDTFRGTLRFGKDLSSTTEIGFEYIHSIYELEESGDSRADAVLFTYTKRLSRSLDLDFGIGGFDTQGEGDNDLVDDTGVQARFNLTKQFQKMRLRLILRHEPTGGGSLSGTSINSVASLDLVSLPGRAWGWRVAPRYAYREPTDDQAEARDSLALRLEVSRRISSKFRIQLRTNYIEQGAEDAAVGNPPVLVSQDREVFYADFGLVWSLLGGSRLSGG